MTQANKKPQSQASAKIASNFADKATKNTFAAVESTRSSAENVMKISGSAMRDFLSSSTEEAQKAQEKAFEFGRESAENIAKSADALTKVMHEMVGISRDNVETCVECCNMTAALAKDISGEIVECANRAFSDTVEISKEAFSCRTLNDVLELQTRVAKQTMDLWFNQSSRLTNMMFEYSTEALEPINERVAQASEQFSKALAA